MCVLKYELENYKVWNLQAFKQVLTSGFNTSIQINKSSNMIQILLELFIFTETNKYS